MWIYPNVHHTIGIQNFEKVSGDILSANFVHIGPVVHKTVQFVLPRTFFIIEMPFLHSDLQQMQNPVAFVSYR